MRREGTSGLKKKKKPPPRVDYKYSRRNTRLVWSVGRGSSPADQPEIEVCYLHFSQNHVRCTVGNTSPTPPSPGTNVWSPLQCPQAWARGQIKRKGKERETHEGAMSLQINLFVASARIVKGGEEKSIGVRETPQSVQGSPNRDGRAPSPPAEAPRWDDWTLAARPSASSGPLTGVSLAQPSLFLPEFDSPVSVLALVDDLINRGLLVTRACYNIFVIRRNVTTQDR